MTKRIGVLIGSLRKDSYSRKIANYLANALSENYEISFIELAQLSIYNPNMDNDADLPVSWQELRQNVLAVDALLFVTPEYNRSIPAVLKNALDIASRPMGKNAWGGKPGAIVSISPGNIGGFGANHHLRQVAACLNMVMMPSPETYLGNIAAAIDAEGTVNDAMQQILSKFLTAFTAWIE